MFQAKEEVESQISLEASLNRGFPSDSENARLSEPPFYHNILLFMRVVYGESEDKSSSFGR
jgi:hypothetical protein